jgi:hypothetical protein
VLDPDFVADCPYAAEAILFDDIVVLDREGGRVVANMPTHERLPLTELQRVHPERHPRHVSGALMIHLTGMLGFAHAYFVLGMRHADGWIGFGTNIHEARYGRLATIGPPLILECRATQVRRIRGSVFVTYAFRFEQDRAVVYESRQSAVWRRITDEGDAERRPE